MTLSCFEQTSEWLNVSEPLDLPMLRGRVIVLLAFQMLCPGCVQTALPQLSRVHETFDHDRVVAMGLHTVFEHHAAMSPTTLRAFVEDRPSPSTSGEEPQQERRTVANSRRRV